MTASRGAGRVRAIGFDLDGTLLDTLPDIAAAANGMLAEMGRAPVPSDTVRSYIGDGIARLTRRLLTGSLDGEPPRHEFDRALGVFERLYFDRVSEDTRPFDGVPSALVELRERAIRLACVTNKAHRFTEALLRKQGLFELFDIVISGDSLARRKPDPLPLLHCFDRLGVSAAEFLYVGDSANDVAAARAAGCRVVCVPYGYTGGRDVRDLGADAIVAGIPDLIRFVA